MTQRRVGAGPSAPCWAVHACGVPCAVEGTATETSLAAGASPHGLAQVKAQGAGPPKPSVLDVN